MRPTCFPPPFFLEIRRIGWIFYYFDVFLFKKFDCVSCMNEKMHHHGEAYVPYPIPLENIWKTISGVPISCNSVTVFCSSSFMALRSSVHLKKVVYIMIFIALCLFTIVGLGSFLRNLTLLSWRVATSKNTLYAIFRSQSTQMAVSIGDHRLIMT